MQAVTFIVALAAIWKALDFIKFAKAGDANGALTLAASWALGIGAAFLFSRAQIAETWDVGVGQSLRTLDGYSLVILGVIWASGGSALVSFVKARDNSDSSAVPTLVKSPGGD